MTSWVHGAGGRFQAVSGAKTRITAKRALLTIFPIEMAMQSATNGVGWVPRYPTDSQYAESTTLGTYVFRERPPRGTAVRVRFPRPIVACEHRCPTADLMSETCLNSRLVSWDHMEVVKVCGKRTNITGPPSLCELYFSAN